MLLLQFQAHGCSVDRFASAGVVGIRIGHSQLCRRTNARCHAQSKAIPRPISAQPAISCARVRRAAGISREASGLGDESCIQPAQRGSLFRQPTTKAHLEPLSEVPGAARQPWEPRKRPPRPYRQIECKYDRGVIPSGCSVEVLLPDDELDIALPQSIAIEFTAHPYHCKVRPPRPAIEIERLRLPARARGA